MRRRFVPILFVSLILATGLPVSSQVLDFDETSEGPWSDIDATTLTVPKVVNDSVQLDGIISPGEYGDFEPISVIPGENAWILNYPTVKEWDSPEDTSFTFYLAYDDNYLYIAVDAKDDVVRSNDENPRFWSDDAIELLVDPTNTDFDYNWDSTPPRIWRPRLFQLRRPFLQLG